MTVLILTRQFDPTADWVIEELNPRPRSFTFPDDMSEAHREWAATEAKRGFLGTLAAVPRWLNHPAQIADAEYKPLQLRIAKRSGLRVPQTLVTNWAEYGNQQRIRLAHHVNPTELVTHHAANQLAPDLAEALTQLATDVEKTSPSPRVGSVWPLLRHSQNEVTICKGNRRHE